jgi:hypothetical protein
MTIEQRNAVQAVLKALSDAVKTGLTKRQIISVIETEMETRYSTMSPESSDDTPQRYGWSALADGEKK